MGVKEKLRPKNKSNLVSLGIMYNYWGDVNIERSSLENVMKVKMNRWILRKHCPSGRFREMKKK